MNFYYVIDIVYIYSQKKLIEFNPFLWCNFEKVDFFGLTHGVLLDNGVTSPCFHEVGYESDLDLVNHMGSIKVSSKHCKPIKKF